jgi:Bacterial Ig-like domain (group 2)
MRAIVAIQLVVAATTLTIGCSSSPTEGPDPTQREQPAPDRPVHRLLVTPNVATIGIGRAITLAAMTDGGDVLSSAEVSWTSSDDEVATVSASGMVLGRRPGQVEIVARSARAWAYARIAVLKSVSERPR